MKKKRNEVTVEIRKNKREETLQKRRNVPNTEDTTGLYTFWEKKYWLFILRRWNILKERFVFFSKKNWSNVIYLQ